jgi:hypothetical protein
MLSGNGASHKNINYQSHHIMYTAHDGTGVTCFAGVQHEVNHTSKTQLQGWKDVIHEMCTMYNECMIGAMAGVANPRELVTKVKGMLIDHAEDQKNLSTSSENGRKCEREKCKVNKHWPLYPLTMSLPCYGRLQKRLLWLREELKGGSL